MEYEDIKFKDINLSLSELNHIISGGRVIRGTYDIGRSRGANTDDISDGYHTFGSLYIQRMILFACITRMFPEKSWKSKKHSDGRNCFGSDNWFIVGVTTPEGNYTYHYEMQYYDLFKCKELDTAPEWDGHTDADVKRLLSLFNS